MGDQRKLSRREFLLGGAALASVRLGFIGYHQEASSKPHINLAVLGHMDHGLSELTAAITHVLSLTGIADTRSVGDINDASEVRALGVPSDLSLVDYETATRWYTQVNGLTHDDSIKNLITGAVQADGAIVVVSAIDGPMPQTREQIWIASQVGVPTMVVFLNNLELMDDAELLELIELELREILSTYGFSEATPIIRGSVTRVIESSSRDPDAPEYAPIRELVHMLDDWIPVPPRDQDRPFLMPIDDVFSIKGRGTVVTGYVERGQVLKGEEVEIIGVRDERLKTRVTGIEMFHKELDAAISGDNAAILLRGIEREDLERGMVLAQPGSIRGYTRFESLIYILRQEEGGRHKAFLTGYRPQFSIRTLDVAGAITLPQDVELLMPGDTGNVEVELIFPAALERGSRFAIREGGLTIGAGVVTRLIE